MESSMMRALLNSWPLIVEHDSMISWLYGADEPSNPAASLRILKSSLAKKLKHSGLQITTDYGFGYRLEFLDAVKKDLAPHQRIEQ